MLTLAMSPNGQNWIFKGFANSDSATNDVMIAGSGAAGSLVAREGDVTHGSTPVAQEGIPVKNLVGVDTYGGFLSLSGKTKEPPTHGETALRSRGRE